MSDKKFTPGPWNWAIQDYSAALLQGPREEEHHVLSSSPCSACMTTAKSDGHWKWGRCTTPDLADARLIESAPDLYETLETIAKWNRNELELGVSLEQFIQKVLAKARGEFTG